MDESNKRIKSQGKTWIHTSIYKYTQAYQVPKKERETETVKAHALLLGLTDMHSNNVLLCYKNNVAIKEWDDTIEWYRYNFTNSPVALLFNI